MSWLRITHATIYHYRKPVRFGPHRIVLRPREGHDSRVEQIKLEINPPAAVAWSRDVFGNSVATAEFSEAATDLHIVNRVILRQTLPLPVENSGSAKPPAYPPTYALTETIVATAYQTTTFPEDLPSVKAWLEEIALPCSNCTAEEIVVRLNQEVHKAISYSRRESRGVQSPAETLRTRMGSCRDLSTLMLEALRLLTFPARFVSGYLDCSASEVGRASTHAWVEAYLPHTGWVGYDPTLGEKTSAQHVVTGVSNHPRGVMPIVGSFFGDQSEYIGMEVSVRTERFTERPPLLASDAQLDTSTGLV